MISIRDEMMRSGYIVEHRDCVSFMDSDYLVDTFSHVGIKIASEEKMVLSKEVDITIVKANNLLAKWRSNFDYLDDMEARFRTYAKPKTTRCFCALANAVKKNDFDRYSGIPEVKNGLFEIERLRLSHFITGYISFEIELGVEIRSLSPRKLKFRNFFESLTFTAHEKERQRMIDGCYHEKWVRKNKFNNACECTRCGLEEECLWKFSRSSITSSREDYCVRCGEKPPR